MLNKTLLAALVLGLAGTAALGEEKLVDNPAYLNWAKYKVGAMQKTKTTSTVSMEGHEMTNQFTTTTTLKELTAEKAVVEITPEVPGAPVKPMRLEIKAKVPAGDAEKPPAMPPGAKATRKGSGDEEIEISGKKYKCHWEEWQMVMEQKEMKMTMTSKVWMCKDVPGSLVKMESSGDMPGGGKMSTKMELVEFKDGA